MAVGAGPPRAGRAGSSRYLARPLRSDGHEGHGPRLRGPARRGRRDCAVPRTDLEVRERRTMSRERNLIDLLRRRADGHGDRMAYTLLGDGALGTESLTYG